MRVSLAVLVGVALLAIACVVSGVVAWNAAYPCWRYSNASWCGHFCDDDPCMCPSRGLGPSAYGGGPGCVP